MFVSGIKICLREYNWLARCKKKITKIKERNKIVWSFSCEMFGKIIRKITDFPCPQINMIKIKTIFCFLWKTNFWLRENKHKTKTKNKWSVPLINIYPHQSKISARLDSSGLWEKRLNWNNNGQKTMTDHSIELKSKHTCFVNHMLAYFLFLRQYQPKKTHKVCGCLIFTSISVQMQRYPLEEF